MIQQNPKRWIALLLTLMLLVGIAPRSYATEETMPETTPVTLPEVTEETTPETIQEPTTEATLVTTPEAAPEESPANSMLAATAYASTVGNVQLFDQASPNYTTYLNRQLSVTYRPNGTDSSKTAYIKNLGWHFARINGVSYPDDPIYCIEPNKNFAASTSGNYVDQGMTVSGSGSTHGADVWYAMPESYRRAIGLVLLYSEQRWDHSYSVMSTPMASNPNVPLRIATQFLIYEIVTGLRNADTFQLNGSNGYTDGDIFYNAGVDNVPYFAPHYNSIVESVQSAMKIPSFASQTSGTAPTITLTGEQTMVVDSNDVVSNFSFQDGNGAQFWTIGNQFYIQQTGNISSSTVFKGTRYLPSADSSTFSVYYGGTSTYQTCVKLHSPSSANLTAYFKLKAPAAGNLAIQKTTEDGKNLSGWQFGIYSNSSCTNLLSGPHTTNSTGKITVSGLTPGTVYVKELGHNNSTINSQYTCSSTNPQAVTIQNGQTASVTFHNSLKKGTVKIIKVVEDPDTGSRAGWVFEILDAAGKSVGTYTTNAQGEIAVDLVPGQYTVKEILEPGTFWECTSENPQAVTVTAGQTASVTFVNVFRLGQISVQKVNQEGTPLEGVEFLLEWSEDGTNWQPVMETAGPEYPLGSCTASGLQEGKLVTGADGMAVFIGLHPQLQYRLTETRTNQGYQLLADYVFVGELSPEKNYKEEFTVVNVPVFRMPATGGKSLVRIPLLILLCVGTCAGLLLYRKKRRHA